MNSYHYTEDQLVEQSAIALFAELGWQTVSAMEEAFGAGGTLARCDYIRNARKSLSKRRVKTISFTGA